MSQHYDIEMTVSWNMNWYFKMSQETAVDKHLNLNSGVATVFEFTKDLNECFFSIIENLFKFGFDYQMIG